MLCILWLFLFSVMSIFSAKYRSYAKEAFECTFRLITLRKCESSLEQKIKAKLASKIAKRSVLLAKYIYRYYNVLSLIFIVLFFVSVGYTLLGIYNYVTYGTCDPSSPESCIFQQVIEEPIENTTCQL